MNELCAHPHCPVSRYGIWVWLLRATAVKAHYLAHFAGACPAISAPLLTLQLGTEHQLDSLSDLCPALSAGQHLISELSPCLSSAVFLPRTIFFFLLLTHMLELCNYSCHSHITPHPHFVFALSLFLLKTESESRTEQMKEKKTHLLKSFPSLPR